MSHFCLNKITQLSQNMQHYDKLLRQFKHFATKRRPYTIRQAFLCP